MDVAYALGAGYVALQEIWRPMLMTRFGDSNCGGTPCWRASLVLFPQFAILPFAVGATALQYSSLRAWCDDAEYRGKLNVLMRFVVLVFYAFLLADLVYNHYLSPPIVLRQLMIHHHLVCFCGHIYATYFCPVRAQPCYLFAICCLEMGSGFANVYWLLQDTAGAWLGSVVYLVTMTISNTTATILAWKWRVAAGEAGLSQWRRWPCFVIVLVLVFMRQKEVHMLVGWP